MSWVALFSTTNINFILSGVLKQRLLVKWCVVPKLLLLWSMMLYYVREPFKIKICPCYCLFEFTIDKYLLNREGKFKNPILHFQKFSRWEIFAENVLLNLFCFLKLAILNQKTWNWIRLNLINLVEFAAPEFYSNGKWADTYYPTDYKKSDFFKMLIITWTEV